MPDYSKGKIYIIRSPHTEEVYIGSTIQTLCKRMGQHREGYTKWKSGNNHFLTCFKLIELGDAYIELVEECPVENKNQLERREGEIMRQTENCINKIIAGRTRQEHFKDNRDSIISKVKEYRANNLELDKQRHKNKYEKNKEEILRQNKTYYEVNKEDILARQKAYKMIKKEQPII